MKVLRYGKSLTIALPQSVYDVIKTKSDEVQESMGTIVREMLEKVIQSEKISDN